MKPFLLILLFIGLLPTVFLGKTTNSGGYKEDLLILKRAFEENYPSLYRFNSKCAIDELFDKSIREVNDSTSDLEFYKTIKHVLSRLEDGHLGCSSSDRIKSQIAASKHYFPLSLYFIENRAYVRFSSIEGIPAGTEVVRINHLSVNSVRKNLFRYIVSDGKIETKKYWILNHSFWFYFNLVYGQTESYHIICKDNNGKLFNTVVSGVSKSFIESLNASEEDHRPLLVFSFISPNIGLLAIRTFAETELQEAQLDFTRFLDASFADLKKKGAAILLIDLRGNGGGKDIYGSLLYSYLTDKPFSYYKRLETSSRVLNENEHANLAIQKPHRNNFGGTVYILIDGLSFSVTSEFCTIAHNNSRAVFVGEETGGTYCGNTSGRIMEIPLPFSGITVSIPTIKYTMVATDQQNKGRGIIPTYYIKPSMIDLIHKKDVQLNMTIELAEKNSRR